MDHVTLRRSLPRFARRFDRLSSLACVGLFAATVAAVGSPGVARAEPRATFDEETPANKFDSLYSCDSPWVKEQVLLHLGKPGASKGSDGGTRLGVSPTKLWKWDSPFTSDLASNVLPTVYVSLPFTSSRQALLDVERLSGSAKTDIATCRFFRVSKTKDWSDITAATLVRGEQDYVRIAPGDTGKRFRTGYLAGTGGFSGVADSGVVVVIAKPQREIARLRLSLHW